MRYVAAVLIVLLALGALTTVRSEREQFAVYAVDLPYHTHITSALTEQAVAMLSSCSEPLTWTQARGWDLPQGFLRLRFVVAIPDEGVYDLIYDHVGRDRSKPLVIRMAGTRWFGASYNPIPQPHGAAGSCWLQEQAVKDFEYQVTLDANWPD